MRTPSIYWQGTKKRWSIRLNIPFPSRKVKIQHQNGITILGSSVPCHYDNLRIRILPIYKPSLNSPRVFLLGFCSICQLQMHCWVGLFLFNLIAIGVFCADWDIFQDNGSASSDATLALSDTGELEPFITNEDPSTKLDPEDLSTITNQEESFGLFDSGNIDTLSDQMGSSNLLASVDNTCSLPPSRRTRARAEGGFSCSNSDGNNPLGSSLDQSIFGSWQIPVYGRKITDYEDADQRLMGQAYCPMHQTLLPGLILPICDSGIPGITLKQLLGVLYTVLDGFLSMVLLPSFLCLFAPLGTSLPSTPLSSRANLTQHRYCSDHYDGWLM